MFNLNGVQLRQNFYDLTRFFLLPINDYNNFYRRILFLRSFLESIMKLYRLQTSSLYFFIEGNSLIITVNYLPNRMFHFMDLNRRTVNIKLGNLVSYRKFKNFFKLIVRKKFLNSTSLNLSRRLKNNKINKRVNYFNNMPFKSKRKLFFRFKKYRRRMKYRKKIRPLSVNLNRTLKYSKYLRKLILFNRCLRVKCVINRKGLYKALLTKICFFFKRLVVKRNFVYMSRNFFLRQLIDFHCIFSSICVLNRSFLKTNIG